MLTQDTISLLQHIDVSGKYPGIFVNIRLGYINIVKMGSLKILKWVYANDIADGTHLLHVALVYKHLAIAKWIIINLKCTYMISFATIVANGYLDILKLIDKDKIYGQLYLDEAITNRHYEFVRYVVENNIRYSVSEVGFAGMIYDNKFEMFKYLYRNVSLPKLITCAAFHGSLDLVKLIYRDGWDVRHAIYLAKQNGFIDIVNYLEEVSNADI